MENTNVKRGHWEKEEDFIGKKYKCTMCKKVIRYDRAYVCFGELIFDFCPFCGADMRGKENDEVKGLEQERHCEDSGEDEYETPDDIREV